MATLIERENWQASPQHLNLPPKFGEWRAGQAELLQRVLDTDKRFVLVEAPTGAGKSLVAAAWQKLTQKRTLYMCTTKQLQDQVLEDFPHAKVLKGRKNYPTRNNPLVSCDECHLGPESDKCEFCVVEKRQDGTWIHDCPYQNAKRELLAANFGVVNTALFLTECNFVGRLSGFEQVVLDEADSIEGQLMGFAELRVGRGVIRLLDLEPPEKVTIEQEWQEWAVRCLRRIEQRRKVLEDYTIRERKSVENLYKQLNYFLQTLQDRGLHWVNCTGKRERARGPWTWKPVRVDPQAYQLLWQHAKRWLMLSATILSPEQYCRDLGLDRADVEFIRLPSTFPVENRPVHYFPVADMNYNNRQAGVADVVAAIDRLLDAHDGEKTLIHSVSYWLTDAILSQTRHRKRIMRFAAASERGRVIEQFRRAQNGAVLLAPGLERGLDLPHDACRVVIMPKLPYPSLADKQVNARLYAYPDGNDWYTLQTARALVQASGRGVRSDDDTCTMYLLDRQFGQFYRKAVRFLPPWWVEALQSHSAGELSKW